MEFGVDSTEIAAYEVYLNYPLDSGLTLFEDGQVKFKARLEEDVLDEDPTTGLSDRVPIFHGYSASGNVTGAFVYANYGTFQDYEDLVKAEIFFVKLAMLFNDPRLGPESCELVKIVLGQPGGFQVLWEMLLGRAWRSTQELVHLKVSYDGVPHYHPTGDEDPVMGVPVEQLTPDGYDLHFGTNVIGPWYFTKSLMPALLHGVASSPDGHSRIVTTSSAGAYMSPLHWDTFTDTPARRKLPPGILYCQSKLVRLLGIHLWSDG